MAKASDPLSRYEARKKPREPFALRPGFEVRVHTRLREGGKERVQTYEGIVTATSGAGLGKTFTVRRVTNGIGIERIFPMFSPLVTEVEVLRATKVRRAKLTYLRKAEAQRRRKEDRGLMRRVEAEREAKRRAKEEEERRAREEREAAEKATKEAAEKKAAKEVQPEAETATEGSSEKPKP